MMMLKLCLYFLVSYCTKRVTGKINSCKLAPARNEGFTINSKSVPYQAIVKRHTFSTPYNGIILNKKYILTAAHIVMKNKIHTVKPEEFKVLFGYDHPCAIKSNLWKKVDQIIPYSNVYSVEYDIALLKLADEIQFSETVMPVRIPLVDKGANLKVLKYGSCHAVDKFEFKTCASFEKGAEVIWGGFFTTEENGNQVVIGLISSYYNKNDKMNFNFISVAKYKNWIHENIQDGEC